MINIQLVDPFPNLDLTLNLEVLKGLSPPLSLPETDMTSCYRALCFATGEVPIDAALTDSMVTFGVDFEAKSGVRTRIAPTNRTFVRCSRQSVSVIKPQNRSE